MASHTNSAAAHNEALDRTDLQDIITEAKSFNLGGNLNTVGFVIKNCVQLLGQSLAKPEVLGWFVQSPDPAALPGAPVKVLELSLSSSGTDYILGFPQLHSTGQAGGTDTTYKILSQRPVPGQPFDPSTLVSRQNSRRLSFGQAQTATQAATIVLSGLRFDHLSEYKPWVREVYFSRSTLEMMKVFLLSHPAEYNDLLFSGSRADFHVMHDPILRVKQLSLSQSDGTFVANSGDAFTLKVEPYKDDDGLDPLQVHNALNPNAPKTAISFTGKASVMGNGRLAAAAMGSPCPDYWQIVEDIQAVAKTQGITVTGEGTGDLENGIENALFRATPGSTASLNLRDFVAPVPGGFGGILYRLLSAVSRGLRNLARLLTEIRDRYAS